MVNFKGNSGCRECAITTDPELATIDWPLVRQPGGCQGAAELRVALGDDKRIAETEEGLE